MKTPKTEKKQTETVEKEKLSGKKLVQARLPFKILTTPVATVDTLTRNDTTNDTSETRKRKLSYESEEGTASPATKKKSVKKGSESIVDKNKKEKDTSVDDSSSKPVDVVLLSDSDQECDVSCSKENVKTVATAKTSILKQSHFESDHEADMHVDDVELIESTDEDTQKAETTVSQSAKQTNTNNQKNEKKSITPKGAGKASGKDRKSAGDVTTDKSKVLIKLPVSAKKNKRRKTSVRQIEDAEEHVACETVELASPVNQPLKRAKLEDVDKEQQNSANEVKLAEKPIGIVKDKKKVLEGNKTEKDEKASATPKNEKTAKVTTPKSNEKNEVKPAEKNKEQKPKNVVSPKTKSSGEDDIKNADDEIVNKPTDKAKSDSPENVQVDLERVASAKKPNTPAASEDETTTESDTNKSKIQELSSSTDDEADAETESTVKNVVTQPDAKATSTVEAPNTPKLSNETTSNKLHKKNLTPKQQKLLEQRLKAREEKERKIQEERLQKQREKEERELAKKRDREEKEEQKRKERDEKEEQRRKEREEKERKRLAEIEMKNEEKRKRHEAKEEELRKKEEERKRKEQEKEEAELKKKKAAMAFTKFFSRPSTAKDSQNSNAQQEEIESENVILAFRPFQIKGAMKLAPTVRKQLTNEAISTLDAILKEKQEFAEEELYVKQLKSGATEAHKWIRPAQVDTENNKQDTESDDDVVVVEDELERAAQAIVEEPVVPVERLHVKFFKFAENRRPPYYGTWRKKSQTITPRRPFAQDKKFFDYEVDSDDEWEEEEPGESLDGSDDEKEKESEDEDYEVDNEWFVPHGHLSDEEMQGEDDLGENNDREAQKAKLQILQKEFAQEMKKKTEKIKPRLIGCIWVDENGNQPELCPKIIWDTLNMRAILCAEPPVLEEIEVASDKNSEANTANGQGNEKNTGGEPKLKPLALNGDLLKQLVKLVHGNTHSKNFIIKEFLAYIEANEESVRNGEFKCPLKSAVREKIDELAQWQVLEQTTNTDDKDNVSSAKKKKNKKKLCWIVSAEKLKALAMEDLDLNNNWQYVLPPREPKQKSKPESTQVVAPAQGDDSNEHSETSVEPTNSPSTKAIKPKADIKKFTRVLTAVEKAQQMQKLNEAAKTPSTKPTGTTTPSSASTSTKPIIPNTAKANSTNNNNNTTPTVKKRVPLLMSVARGQSIPTPDKNARISQFLKNLNDAKQKEKAEITNEANPPPPMPMDVDEVVILD